jgi:alkylation response protein AidB-like acyl-CoA dehydrogenase
MSDLFTSASFLTLLTDLQQSICEESVDAWPREQLAAMARAGVMQWDVPVEWGGLDFGPVEQIEGLRLLASSSLVSTFIWTQRSAAVRRIAASDNQTAKKHLLPRLLSGDIFATVGISHLTTSGQHLKTPSVSALPDADGFVLSGTVPWATSATQADFLVTGGTLPDGLEILVCLPTDRQGLEVQAPITLMGLNASQTGAIVLKNVRVDRMDLLHGPIVGVMRSGTGGGAGSIGTSALAVGAATGTLRQFAKESQQRSDLAEFVAPLTAECERLTADLTAAALGTETAMAAERLRQRANSLVVRSAQAWLAATKGAGYVAGHPAERAVRESMFFLVWSCPGSVLAGNLRELSCATFATNGE